MVVLLGGAAASVASADISFCPRGSAAGQCKSPAGIAVDQESGRVYVADSGNDRINVFDEDGNFQSSFSSSGNGPGQLSSPRKVAVDDNPASPNFGDVYVTDASPRVQRFSSSGVFEATIGAGQLNRSNPPIAVGAANDLYVVDSTGPGAELDNRQVKIFSPAGALVGSSTIGVGLFGDAVVDSTGALYINRTSAGGGIEKYGLSEPTATLLDSFDSASNTRALAVDGADNLYAAQLEGPFRLITKRNSTGTILSRFGYGEIQFNLEGLAVGATGALFGSEEFAGGTSGNKVIRIPQSPPGPLSCCAEVFPGNTKATLKGQVNPEGAATTYHFEYLTEAQFIANGSSFSGPNVPVSTPDMGPVGSDFVLHPAQAAIGCTTPADPPQAECLEPETRYHARLVATNADDEGEENSSPEFIFETREPLEIKDTWSTEVGLDDATLHAEINPLGIPASAFFEYVDDATFQASGFADAVKAPAAPIAVGGGEAFVTVSAPISSLAPGTVYHYRVVAFNAFIEDEPMLGKEETLLTFPTPYPVKSCTNDAFRIGFPSATLPDCRAYEMVSPIDKNGGDIKVLVQAVSYPARLDQSADSGDAFTYSAVTAFAEPQSALWSSQYLAQRGASAWSTEAINQPKDPNNLTDNPILKLDVQYRAFDADLAKGWVSQYANPQLDDCAPQGVINLYRRDNASGAYEALVSEAPAEAITAGSDYRIELQGLSADGARAVFRANAKLTPDASSVKGIYQLYMHIADPEGGCGQLRLLSVKPNGSAITVNSSVGSPRGQAEYRQSTVARGVSANGSRVFFSTGSVTSTETGPLYVRVNADQPPVSGGKCGPAVTLGCTLEITSTNTQFWTAAADGSRVVYSVGEELFEYDVDKAIKGEAAKTLISSGAEGVVGASEDASRIYFISDEQIDGEGAADKPNLYLYEPGKAAPDRYRLVATLSARDLSGLGLFGLAVGSPRPISNGVRVSPDGSHVAFVSQGGLGGYDSHDAATGEPAIEVYLYDTESEEVRCVSCNPSGARPATRKLEEGEEGEGSTISRYVAAMMAPGESQTFAPRSLSADGNRLFFESFDALLPRDVNAAMDVYEWQRADSVAACQALGMELFVPASGGCLSLISSGQEESDSEFADASPDGSDVFIRTASSLVPQDPGQVDIYDAREGGGLPIPALPRIGCAGEQQCRGSAPPTPPATGIATQGPSSGNVPAPKPCPKGKTRNKAGKCVKKKHHKKKGKGHKKKAAKNKKGAKR